jgi:hypothetical protein
MLNRKLVAIGLMSLFALPVGAQAQTLSGPTKLTFSMPTAVDPPPKFLDHGPVPATPSELATGLNLYGRAMTFDPIQCSVQLEDITCIQITFTSTSGVKVSSVVQKGLDFVPWAVQTFKEANNVWRIVLTAQAGSAPLTSWDWLGDGKGFFALLTASQGSGLPASISNVSISPCAWTNNKPNKSSSDVADNLEPTIGASVDKPVIWSPNGKPVNVVVNGSTFDPGQPTPTNYISGVNVCSIHASLSYRDGGGTPVSLPDLAVNVVSAGGGVFHFTVPAALESARNGTSLDGRVYTITIIVTDFAGKVASYPVTVTVSHDQGSQ